MRPFNHWMPADYIAGSPSVYRIYKRTVENPLTFKQQSVPGKRMSYLYQMGRTQVICTTRKLPLEELTSPDKVLKTLDYIMVNATGSPSAYKKVEVILDTHKHLTVLQDSGGYQLFTGVRDYVDPVAVAKRHLLLPKGRREGVGLDLPLGAGIPSDSLLKRTVTFQTQNNTKIRDAGYEDPLFYTSHGVEPRTRVAYLEQLVQGSSEKIEYLAISALRNIMAVGYTPSLALIAATATYCAAKVKPKRLHLLGVSSVHGFLVISLLKRRFPNMVITCDSATYLLAAASGRWTSRTLAKGPGPTNTRHPTHMFCPCNICQSFGNYFAPSIAAKGNLVHSHNFASQAHQGLLQDPLLSYLEAQHPEIVALVFAEESKLEKNLLRQGRVPNTHSLFTVKGSDSSYEVGLAKILERYGV